MLAAIREQPMALPAGDPVQNAGTLQVLDSGSHCGERRFDLLRSGRWRGSDVSGVMKYSQDGGGGPTSASIFFRSRSSNSIRRRALAIACSEVSLSADEEAEIREE